MIMRCAFHLVELRSWPLYRSLGALILTRGLVGWFRGYGVILLSMGLLCLVLVSFQWWRDVVRESTFGGEHRTKVLHGLKLGIVLFIISEVCFFFSFFWAFFHRRLAPVVEIGAVWPPVSIMVLDPFTVPLLNTAVLLASGVSVTWAHHSLIDGERTSGIWALTITVLLGIYFTCLQVMEYKEAPFSIADGIYGSTFFVATGFHGLHVLIGTLFLFVCFWRLVLNHFSMSHFFGFEAAAWYWHFVDVVWLFLYLSIYWWGSALHYAGRTEFIDVE